MTEYKDIKIGEVFTNQGRHYTKDSDLHSIHNESGIKVHFKENLIVNEGR